MPEGIRGKRKSSMNDDDDHDPCYSTVHSFRDGTFCEVRDPEIVDGLLHIDARHTGGESAIFYREEAKRWTFATFRVCSQGSRTEHPSVLIQTIWCERDRLEDIGWPMRTYS